MRENEVYWLSRGRKVRDRIVSNVRALRDVAIGLYDYRWHISYHLATDVVPCRLRASAQQVDKTLRCRLAAWA